MQLVAPQEVPSVFRVQVQARAFVVALQVPPEQLRLVQFCVPVPELAQVEP